MRAPQLHVSDLTVVRGTGPTESVVLERLSLDVGAGEIVAVTGPSGCGKTTLLNVLAGFLPPTSGRACVDDLPITGPGVDRVLVFQELALFDWLTARENVRFGLRLRGLPAAEQRRRADDYLDKVRLTGAAERYPHELSGGMKQRLALARALAVEPACLLLDEPLAGLDYHLRIALQDLILELWREQQSTVIVVTHDAEEAAYLADRIVIMGGAPGRILDVVGVGLPRPRSFEWRESPHARAIYRTVRQWLVQAVPTSAE